MITFYLLLHSDPENLLLTFIEDPFSRKTDGFFISTCILANAFDFSLEIAIVFYDAIVEIRPNAHSPLASSCQQEVTNIVIMISPVCAMQRRHFPKEGTLWEKEEFIYL